jgi:hypothetical protein
MELFVCTVADIDRAWADGASNLAKACEWALREVTADQLKFLLARGERTLLGLRDEGRVKAWAAVQVQQLPNIRVLYVYSIFAPGATGPGAFEKLKEYAKYHGCTTIRGACSESVEKLWVRKFQAKPLYKIMEIEVQ